MADKANKNRKYGRNIKWCTAYKAQDKRYTNKVRKINRHIKRFPADLQAPNALRSIEQRRINALRKSA